MARDVHRSPFRYPGGKGALTTLLGDVIKANFGKLETYCEPFAGGAGAATQLLGLGLVERAHLNDADPRVFFAWKSLLRETERFIEILQSVPLTMKEWWRQKEIIENVRQYTEFEVGFATFYLNRTNRSGILQGAGPIGGYAQEGKWGIDARFNRSGLIDRIRFLSEKRDQIELTDKDGVELIRSAERHSSLFFFIDPPYVGAGSRLYFNSMDEEKHRQLSKILLSSHHHWLMTYDDAELVRTIYAKNIIDEIPIRYALQNKRLERELLIRSPDILLPAVAR